MIYFFRFLGISGRVESGNMKMIFSIWTLRNFQVRIEIFYTEKIHMSYALAMRVSNLQTEVAV